MASKNSAANGSDLASAWIGDTPSSTPASRIRSMFSETLNHRSVAQTYTPNSRRRKIDDAARPLRFAALDPHRDPLVPALGDGNGCGAPDHGQPAGAQRDRHGQSVARGPREIGPCGGYTHAPYSATTGPQVRNRSSPDGVFHALRVPTLRAILRRRVGGVSPRYGPGGMGHPALHGLHGIEWVFVPERPGAL